MGILSKEKNKLKNEAKKKQKELRDKTKEEKSSFLKSTVKTLLIFLLILIIGVTVVGRFVDHPLLQMPREMLAKFFAPVQTFFSSATNTVTSYFHTLKLRSNLEYEYETLVKKAEELQDKAMMADSYKAQLDALNDLMNEMIVQTDLDPIAATVIGHDTASYFSVLTLDRGSRDGITSQMAVVYGGGLVGYTYDVTETTCEVRTIIDSDCKIAAQLESTGAQGTVKGTLGVDGLPACRMYYLPENHLARAGDTVITSGVGTPFPKGIPIGTVRESTRGLEDNKQYVVIEPIVNFQLLEYVTIFRYVPSYAETAENNEIEAQMTLVPLATPWPLPTFAVGAGTSFEEGWEVTTPTPEPASEVTPSPTPSPTPTPTIDPNITPAPTNRSYVRTSEEPGETPTPTPAPTPTPEPEFDPGELHWEEDED